jgi:hypothetical protein
VVLVVDWVTNFVIVFKSVTVDGGSVAVTVTVTVTAGASVHSTLETLWKWSGVAEAMTAREQKAKTVKDFIVKYTKDADKVLNSW